jgi:hypothetical protein
MEHLPPNTVVVLVAHRMNIAETEAARRRCRAQICPSPKLVAWLDAVFILTTWE